jgi:hypothetical protein
VLVLFGCSSGGELPQRLTDTGPAPAEPGQVRLPFLVEDHFVPNGCFGDGDCDESVISIDAQGCPELPAGAQGGCRVYTYKPLAEGAPGYKGYLGILFQDVGPGGESRIGHVPPLPVQAGAKRVVFRAKVGKGEVAVAFRAGGANNWEGDTDSSLPYKDEFGVPGDAVVGTSFRQYSIDLNGVSYSGVVSPFGWAMIPNGNVEPVMLYIADVRWE